MRELEIQKYDKIAFTQEEIAYVDNLVKQIIKAKQKEDIHRIDGDKEYDRWTTGLLGELAVEKYFNIKIIEESIGDSEIYAHADLEAAGYNVGVKTCQHPRFPVINRNIKTPQIFVMLNKDKTQAIILGLADVSLLKENLADVSNDKFIINKKMLFKKTAFSKVEKLNKINSIDDLEKYKIN